MSVPAHREALVELPGPGSLHWRWAGEVRGYLLLVKAGLLQLMHPGLGAGVEQHSDFFNEPWERVLRSVPEIQGVTFDWPDGAGTARRIRDYHAHIKGLDGGGRRYHALDPEVYFWAHATIFDALFQMIDLFDHPMTDDEKERLYAESRQVYRAYGVSDRVVPPDWASFVAYFDRMCREELVITPAARGLIEFAKEPPATFPLVPAPLYKLARKPTAKPLWWLSVGTLPPVVREQIGERWTERDERRHRMFRRAVGHRLARRAAAAALHRARASRLRPRRGSGRRDDLLELVLAEPDTDAVGESIVDAALEEFLAYGLRRTNVDVVARRAGVSRATLYRRFDGKDALVQAVLVRESRRFFAGIASRGARPGRPRGSGWWRGSSWACGYAREDRLLNRLLASDAEALLPYLTTNGALVVAAARDFLVRQAPGEPVAGRTPAGVAEVFVRLAISFTLLPQSAIPLDTDEEVRAFARAYLAPLMSPG